MATIRKRGDKWRVGIYKNGVSKSKTYSMKAEATLWGAEEEKNRVAVVRYHNYFNLA